MPRDLETLAPVGVTAQLEELKRLREKLARGCEKTRRVVFEYWNIVALRQQCCTGLKANLYFLYGTPCQRVEHSEWDLGAVISAYLQRIGGNDPVDHGCNPGKRESRGPHRDLR
jgi:hypothetical protein